MLRRSIKPEEVTTDVLYACKSWTKSPEEYVKRAEENTDGKIVIIEVSHCDTFSKLSKRLDCALEGRSYRHISVY